MTVTLNGEPREVAEGCTVEALIEELGLAGAICAAEVNKSIVPRGERETRTLGEGDVVEIVTLVGGG